MNLTYWSAPGMKSLRPFFSAVQLLKIEGEAFIKVMGVVCIELELNPSDLIGKTRDRTVMEGRHLVFYLLTKHTQLTLKSIGRSMGGRDHTTVIHGRHSIMDRIDTEPEFKQLVESIEQKII